MQMQNLISSGQDNDAKFLSLLSTQREILKKLSREKSINTKDGRGKIKSKRQRESVMNFTVSPTNHGLLGESAGHISLMNQPIIERRLNHNELPRDNIRGSKRVRTTTEMYSGMNEPLFGRKPEQYKSLGGLLTNEIAFDVDLTTTNALGIDDLSSTNMRGNGSLMNTQRDAYKRVHRMDTDVDQSLLKCEFEKFASAMEKSSKSQQIIHDWDRRMGLKKSHSKTMRLSMRSRDELRKVIQT
mmetsp:Transcript_23553/g.50102  ORF Transcript_23553/g.50102 Transcript_23553/m.50102 type:complete len:242 (-) Transcript_23553:57-782(-)